MLHASFGEALAIVIAAYAVLLIILLAILRIRRWFIENCTWGWEDRFGFHRARREKK